MMKRKYQQFLAHRYRFTKGQVVDEDGNPIEDPYRPEARKQRMREFRQTFREWHDCRWKAYWSGSDAKSCDEMLPWRSKKR